MYSRESLVGHTLDAKLVFRHDGGFATMLWPLKSLSCRRTAELRPKRVKSFEASQDRCRRGFFNLMTRFTFRPVPSQLEAGPSQATRNAAAMNTALRSRRTCKAAVRIHKDITEI